MSSMTGTAPPPTRVAVWPAVTVATAAMATSMIALYAVGGLGPFLVADLGLSRAGLGSLVTATFGVAALSSLVAGHAVDVVGARRGLLVLCAVVGSALIGAGLAGSYGWLVVAVALAGIGQAIANPATNLLVADRVPVPRRGLAIGLKQSGVQLAAVTGGALLPALAGAVGWRGALLWTAVLPVASAGLLLVVLPSGGQPPVTGSWWRWSRPSRWLGRLMGYSLLLGTGLAAVNTYLSLYAVQQLGLGVRPAGLVLAAFGLAGLVARVWWSRWVDRLPDAAQILPWLSAGAVVAVGVVWAAQFMPALVWLGALGIGATATGANAVSMVAVVRRGGTPGHASGMVSLGFFSGFVVGPAAFGVIADHLGYSVAWLFVVAAFAGSAGVALARPKRSRRAGVSA